MMLFLLILTWAKQSGKWHLILLRQYHNFLLQYNCSSILGDRPLIVQFAASNGKDLADAAELVEP